MNSPKKMINAVKSITAKEIFRLHPEVKVNFGVGNFRRADIMSTQGQYANEEVIKKYLQNQGKSEYEEIHSNQLRLF